jgi:hypothetical protein
MLKEDSKVEVVVNEQNKLDKTKKRRKYNIIGKLADKIFNKMLINELNKMPEEYKRKLNSMSEDELDVCITKMIEAKSREEFEQCFKG